MPVRQRVYADHGFVHTVWEGKVTMEDGQAHNEALRNDPDFCPSMKQLSDARTAESAVSGDGVRTLAKTSAFGPQSRRAILVADDNTFGVSRMYEAQADQAGEVRIFRDEVEALDWLGIDPGVLSRD